MDAVDHFTMWAGWGLLVLALWQYGKELTRANCLRAELDRWRINWHESRRWLAEFPDVADALDYLKAEVDDTQSTHINNLRDRMRRRRDATVPETSKPADFSSSESKSSSSGGGGGSDGGFEIYWCGWCSCYDGRNSK